MDIFDHFNWCKNLGITQEDAINYIEKINKATIGYLVTTEEMQIALEKISQNHLGPETCAETVNPNSKSDLEIFDQNINIHTKDKIHYIDNN